MAPAKKKRQNEYFDVGVQGRRTGITLPENSRDSFGVEDIDGIFSSPEKPSAAKPIDAPSLEPTHAPSTRKLLRSTKTSLPPPSARSPFKTNLGSSPRRRRSSVVAPPTNRSVKRKLEFRADEPRPSIEQGDIPIDPQLSDSRSNSYKPKGGSSSASRKRPREEEYVQDDESLAFVNGNADDLVQDFNDPVEVEEVNGQAHSSPMMRKTKKTRNSDSRHDLVNGHSEHDAESGAIDSYPEDIDPGHPYPTPRRNRPATIIEESVEPEPEEPEEPAEPTPKPAKAASRKRQPKNKKSDMPPPSMPASRTFSAPLESDTTGDEYQPAAKKATSRGKKGKGVLTARDPNTSAPRPNGNNLLKQNSRKPTTSGKLAIMAREPTVEPLITTRSGRRTFAPIAHWRAEERIQYGWDGEVMDIQRAPSEELGSKPSHKARSKSRAKSQSKELGTIAETKVNLEEWEKNGEILVGAVTDWDNEQGEMLEDEYQAEIAHGPISVPTREMVGADFRFGKILNLPFFGAGVVELPPGGFKREKNSRRMHMAFFVQTGKVEVTLGDNEFIVSAGGCWQVPRGNFYAVENPYEHEARVFFAQACERPIPT